MVLGLTASDIVASFLFDDGLLLQEVLLQEGTISDSLHSLKQHISVNQLDEIVLVTQSNHFFHYSA